VDRIRTATTSIITTGESSIGNLRSVIRVRDATDEENDEYIQTIYGRFLSQCKKRLDLTYDYEHETLLGFCDIVKVIEADVLLDIGANIGVYSVYLAGNVPSLGEVFAFEPSPASYDLLRQNCEMVESPTILTNQVALSDETGTAEFTLFNPTSGANALIDTMERDDVGDEVIEVPTQRLDDFMESRAGKVIAIKIDVEGHELNVLSGSNSLLQNNRVLLQVECLSNSQAEKVQTLLKAYGFQMLFRLKNDYVFSNIWDDNKLTVIQGILFQRVADSLKALKNLRRAQRRITASALQLDKTIRRLNESVVSSDPLVVE